MKFFACLSLGLMLLSISGCDFGTPTDEEMIAREIAERDKNLDGNVVAFYKAVKLALRALPAADAGHNTISEEDAEALSGAGRIAAEILQTTQDGDESTQATPGDYVELIRKFADAKEVANRVDEDEFPTVLEHFDYVLSYPDAPSGIAEQLGWDNEIEHIFFWLLTDRAPQLPRSWAMYEISKVQPEKMPDTDLKCAVLLAQSFAYLNSDWPWLAESCATKSIDLLESTNITILSKENINWLGGNKLTGDEVIKVELHAASVLTRALCRLQMDRDDKKELAFEDLDTFLTDCEKLGAENELVWLVGAMVSLHNNDRDKAAAYLEKLANSDQLGADEKAAIAECQQFLASSNTDAALRKLTDNAFVAKVVVKYGYVKFKDSKWYDQLQNSKAGKLLLSVPNRLDKAWEKVKSTVSVSEAMGDLF